MMDFETALAEVSKNLIVLQKKLCNSFFQATVREEDRRDNNALYRPMTVKDLKAKHPQVSMALC